MVARATSAKKTSAGGNYFSAPKNKISFIKTGSKNLDLALGGGWVGGRIFNIVGDKSTGKTLLAIEACANFALQFPKGKIYYREAESAFDKEYAAALGFPVSRVIFGDEQINTVEEMYEDLEHIAKTEKVPTLYILDSLDALSDAAEMARDIGDASYGTGKAKKMSEMFRKLVRALNKSNVTVGIISQIRDNLSLGHKKYTRSGGHALDFYATHVLLLQHMKVIKRMIQGQERPTGILIKAKVEKNKIALAYREAEFPILFGFGVDDATACLNYLKETKALGLLNLSEAKLKQYRIDLNDMNDRDYRDELVEIREATEKRFYEIEATFVPTRKKYA